MRTKISDFYDLRAELENLLKGVDSVEEYALNEQERLETRVQELLEELNSRDSEIDALQEKVNELESVIVDLLLVGEAKEENEDI